MELQILELQNIIFVLDKIGILSFAFIAIAKGIRKNLDIFGLLVLGIVSSVGGGILRDLLFGQLPFAISNFDYLAFSFSASIFSILLYRYKIKISPLVLNLTDAIGLGAFAASGALLSLSLELSILHTLLSSVITAIGGGLIRDILINEIPFILKKEVYATAAGAGGIIIHILSTFEIDISTSVFIGLISVITIRIISIKNNWHLPVIN